MPKPEYKSEITDRATWYVEAKEKKEPKGSFDYSIVGVANRKNGIFEFYIESDDAEMFESGDPSLLFRALSWWRKETKTKIISVIGFDGREDTEAEPKIFVVAEIES